MEEIRITVPQAADIFKKSRQTIYNWLEAKKFRYIETAKGKIIITSQKELEMLLEYENGVPSSSGYVQMESSQDDQFESSFDKPLNLNQPSQVNYKQEESTKLFLDKLTDLENKLVQEAKKAGQVQLLTDNILTKEQDSKFWQDKYFESENELKNLIKLNAQLENANRQFQMRLEHQGEKLAQFEKEKQSLQDENHALKENLDKRLKWTFWR